MRGGAAALHGVKTHKRRAYYTYRSCTPHTSRVNCSQAVALMEHCSWQRKKRGYLCRYSIRRLFPHRTARGSVCIFSLVYLSLSFCCLLFLRTYPMILRLCGTLSRRRATLLIAGIPIMSAL